MNPVGNHSSAGVGPVDLRVSARCDEMTTSRTVRRCTGIALVACALTSAVTEVAFAHGFAGKRFFPATLTTDDPFVADELSMPTISSRKMAASGDQPETQQTGFAIDFTKRITTDLGIGFGATYLRLQPDGAEERNGFDNLATNIKYQFYKSEEYEAILSAGIDWDIGGSGSERVGAESFSTVTPTLFFGKGFGDLPDSARFLRPLAVTGLAGIAIPTRASTTTVGEDGDVSVEQHPDVFRWGFSIQYSVPYLQSFVKDVGLREPFNRIIPVIEFALETPLNRRGGGTTGTVNPGILWAGRYIQFGIEAMIPINSRTGGRTGVIAQVHFFLDDLFPQSLGKPLIGH